MWLDTIKLGFGHNLLMGFSSEKINLARIAEKMEREHRLNTESYGLFDSSQPNYTTYYPDVKAEDLNPVDADFIEPPFRALSEVIVHKSWNPVDFAVKNVLKNSLGLLTGATVNPDHESTIVGNAIGAVSKTAWQESYKADGGIMVPAGINAILKIDGKSNPRIARGIMMDPPSIHSTSVTVQFLWDKSHASLSEEEFFRKLGTYDKDGVMIRRMATKIKKYPEISLVHHGADPYAMKIMKDGKIVNPKYADTSYNSEQAIKLMKEEKFFFFDFKTDLIQNEEKNTIPIVSNDNKTISDMDFLAQLAAAHKLPADKHTEEAVLAATTEAATTAIRLQASVDSLTTTNSANATEITRLKVLETELVALKASNPTAEKLTALESFKTKAITAKRDSVTALYNKVKNNKPDASITTMISNSEDLAALEALEVEYTTQLEQMFPSKCSKCGSTSITKASAVTAKEEEKTAPKTSKEVTNILKNKLRKQNSIPLNADPSVKK